MSVSDDRFADVRKQIEELAVRIADQQTVLELLRLEVSSFEKQVANELKTLKGEPRRKLSA